MLHRTADAILRYLRGRQLLVRGAPAINVDDDGIGSPYYDITAMYTRGTEQ